MLYFTFVDRDHVKSARLIRVAVLRKVALRHAHYLPLFVTRHPEGGMTEIRGFCGFDFTENQYACGVLRDTIDFPAPSLVIARYDGVTERKKVFDCSVLTRIPLFAGIFWDN